MEDLFSKAKELKTNGVGYFFPNLGPLLQPYYPICFFVMPYPMVVNIKLGEVAGTARRMGFIAIAMALNYLLSPLAAADLAWKGLKQFMALRPVFPAISALGMDSVFSSP